jgi:hypothetical protein
MGFLQFNKKTTPARAFKSFLRATSYECATNQDAENRD